MKFQVEINDFWLDDEQDIETGLKKYVINQVIYQIQESIKKKVEDAITLEVKRQIEQTMYAQISLEVKDIIQRGTFRENGKDKSMTEFIQQKFEANSGWQDARSVIEGIAKSFGEQMKKRYDILFATQIVAKMKDNGFLNENAANILIDNQKQ